MEPPAAKKAHPAPNATNFGQKVAVFVKTTSFVKPNKWSD
jgi:hypothetical protein